MARAYRYHAGPIPGQTTDAVSNPGIFIAHRVYSISLRSSAGDWLDASQVYRRLPRHQLQRLMYILSTGCQWRALPKDLPPRSTVHDYLDLWSYDGTLDRIHHALYAACREQSEREASPTAALSDFVPGHRPCRQSGFDLMAKGRNKRPISPCASVCGRPAVQAGPFAPRAVFKPRQRRDQFDFGAKSIFAVPIERQNPAIAQVLR